MAAKAFFKDDYRQPDHIAKDFNAMLIKQFKGSILFVQMQSSQIIDVEVKAVFLKHLVKRRQSLADIQSAFVTDPDDKNWTRKQARREVESIIGNPEKEFIWLNQVENFEQK